MEAFGSWLNEVLSHLGYTEIFFLMAIEASLFPLPSELVMVPAGYLAARGDLDPVLATLAGGAGSLFGAAANYLLGKYVGRGFLIRYGPYLLINRKAFDEAEAMFLRNANMATFIGRLIPAVRQLISLPAGVFGMRILPFAVLTTLGASIWCAVLVALGYYLGEPVVSVVSTYTHEVGIAALAGLLLFGLWFLWRHRGKTQDRRQGPEEQGR